MALVINKPTRTIANTDEEIYRYLCRLAEDINTQFEQFDADIRQLNTESEETRGETTNGG